jgi:hypothetical protein
MGKKEKKENEEVESSSATPTQLSERLSKKLRDISYKYSQLRKEREERSNLSNKIGNRGARKQSGTSSVRGLYGIKSSVQMPEGYRKRS